jgi:hypothetical protein
MMTVPIFSCIHAHGQRSDTFEHLLSFDATWLPFGRSIMMIQLDMSKLRASLHFTVLICNTFNTGHNNIPFDIFAILDNYTT